VGIGSPYGEVDPEGLVVPSEDRDVVAIPIYSYI